MVNISPIAKGKLERAAKTLLSPFLRKPKGGGGGTPPSFLCPSETLPFSTMPLSSSETGGATSKRTIFFLVLLGKASFLVLWKLLSLELGLRKRWALEDGNNGEIESVLMGFRRRDINGWEEDEAQCSELCQWWECGLWRTWKISSWFALFSLWIIVLLINK